jgi:hypothetical protein
MVEVVACAEFLFGSVSLQTRYTPSTVDCRSNARTLLRRYRVNRSLNRIGDKSPERSLRLTVSVETLQRSATSFRESRTSSSGCGTSVGCFEKLRRFMLGQYQT